MSDREIVAAAEAGAAGLDDVGAACGAGTDCHGCHERIWALVDAVRPSALHLQAS